MLFNLETDPHEQHDLAASRPEICREGAARLLDWHDGMMASSSTNVDPLWTVMREGGPYHAKGKLPAYLERLKATGREWAVAELQKRHPGAFPVPPAHAPV